jgi:hypothetical protein
VYDATLRVVNVTCFDSDEGASQRVTSAHRLGNLRGWRCNTSCFRQLPRFLMDRIIQTPGSSTRAWQLVRTIASRRAIGLLVFVVTLRLAWGARKEARLVHDLDKVGERVVGEESADEKVYDVIIVGGGMCSGLHPRTRASKPKKIRHGGMRARVSALRRPSSPGAPTRGWTEVSEAQNEAKDCLNAAFTAAWLAFTRASLSCFPCYSTDSMPGTSIPLLNQAVTGGSCTGHAVRLFIGRVRSYSSLFLAGKMLGGSQSLCLSYERVDY